MFKIASLAVTWMLSSDLRCTNSHGSGQVRYVVLPRKAYYGSEISIVCITVV